MFVCLDLSPFTLTRGGVKLILYKLITLCIQNRGTTVATSQPPMFSPPVGIYKFIQMKQLLTTAVRFKCSGVGNFAPFLPLNWLPWQRPLIYWKKKAGLIISRSVQYLQYLQSSTPKTLSYGIKIAKIARGLCFAYDTKLVAMATSLRNRKTGPDQENSRKYLPLGEKIVKIGPVDTEIALLRVKKIKKKRRN